MARSIKWIDVGVDADVHDGEMTRPAAAAARFEVSGLAREMGYEPSEVEDEDALAMGRKILERLNDSVRWADEPWIVVRRYGDCVRALTGPGTVDLASWEEVVEAFAQTCARHGHHGARAEVGMGIESAMTGWFSSTPPPEPRRRGAPPG